MRSARFLAVAVLAVVLALSAAQNAFAMVELVYDDGTPVGVGTTEYNGVRFSLPSGVTSARLLYIRFEWNGLGMGNVYIMGPDHQTLLTAPTIVNQGTGIACPGTWVWCGGYDLSGLGIVVTGDFYVVIQDMAGGLMHDAANSGRSFGGPTLAGVLANSGPGDWLLRVDIDPVYPTPSPVGAVGGFMEPVNKVAVLAPWLAVIGLVGCIGTVVVVAKKCR